jgi:hypothetical protein
MPTPYTKQECANPTLRDDGLCGMSHLCRHCQDDPNKRMREHVQWLAKTKQEAVTALRYG